MRGELITTIGEKAFCIITVAIVVIFIICSCLVLIETTYEDWTEDKKNEKED